MIGVGSGGAIRPEPSTRNAILAIQVGGDGAAGNGGSILVNEVSGTIRTHGIGASGIFAQSVGGGGGTGGAGAAGVEGTITLGSSANSSGNGGGVQVFEFQYASIETGPSNSPAQGPVAAYGIFAQSVGGGGGYAGNVQLGPSSNFGSGLAMGAPGGNGSGGNVAVYVDGSIVTAGDGSIGVVAQSVGGGGGIRGGVTADPAAALVGSAGGVGVAGNVDVYVNGSVRTGGSEAYGVLAQAAGGSTAAANGYVNVAVRGSVQATGPGAHGVFAQNVGAGKGPITVTVTKGALVEGGIAAGTAGEPDGAGIFIMDGTTSFITNSGTIRSAAGTGGVAIHALDSDLTIVNDGVILGDIIETSSLPGTHIENHGTINGPRMAIEGVMDGVSNDGTITGNVAISGLTAPFANQAGGVFNIGTSASLQAAGNADAELDNAGILSPGGANNIITTTLFNPASAGGGHVNLVQTSTGVLAVDMTDAQTTGTATQVDRIQVDGTADLAGTVRVSFNAGNAPSVGPQTAGPIVTAVSGVTAATQSNLTVTSSVVANYSLSYPDPNNIALSYDIDFTGSSLGLDTSHNRVPITRYLQTAFAAGALNSDVANSLIAIPDQATYLKAIDSLDPEISVDTQFSTLRSGLRFADALLSCAEQSGTYRYFDEGQCGWLITGGNYFTQGNTSDNFGFHESGWQLAAGGQLDLGNGWHIGAGFSYEQNWLNASSIGSSSEINQYNLGMSVKYIWRNTEFAATATGGWGTSDNRRAQLLVIGTAAGQQDLHSVGGRLRVSHLFDMGGWYLKPHGGVGVEHLATGSYTESGAGAVGLQIQGQSQTYVYLQPGIDIGSEFRAADDALIRPQLGLGVTHFVGDVKAQATARIVSTGSGVGDFTTTTAFDCTWFNVGAAVDIFLPRNITARAGVYANLSQHSAGFGGGLKLQVGF